MAIMKLRKFRRAAGLTATQLAQRSGVDLTIISRLEHGRTMSATYENTVRLARALGLEPEELAPVPGVPRSPLPRTATATDTDTAQ